MNIEGATIMPVSTAERRWHINKYHRTCNWKVEVLVGDGFGLIPVVWAYCRTREEAVAEEHFARSIFVFGVSVRRSPVV